MSDASPVRVLVVEDDRGLRASLELLLDSDPAFRCAGSAGSAEEGLRRFGPGVDVVLLDVNLPGEKGSEAVARFRSMRPEAPVVMLTVHDDDEVFRSLCNGASGYLLKKTPPRQILSALAEARSGGAPMSPEIARKVVASFHGRPAQPPRDADEALSAQEKRLLALLVDGATYQIAADAMGISVNTVRNYVRSIYEKLHVHSKAAAVSKALRSRLV
jgi:DNA-binding NarL/FixJ family response regulator